MMHHLGSKLVHFLVSIAVFAVYITKAFPLQVLPFNSYKVAIHWDIFVSV